MRISWTITILVAVTNALEYGVPCDPTPVYRFIYIKSSKKIKLTYIYRDNWQYEDSCQNVYLYCDSGSKSCKYKGCTNSDYVKG